MRNYNLAHDLYEMAETHPDQLAIALPTRPGRALTSQGPIPYREISFKELAEETNRISQGLLASGFKSGDRVVLMVPASLEFFTISFAMLQSGIVPVLIDPGIGLKNLNKCIGESCPNGFIGITKAHIARVLLGWGKSTIKKRVTLGHRLFWGGYNLKTIKKLGRLEGPTNCFQAKANDLSGISFTSGSTGIPKGVIVTHGNMRHQAEMIRTSFAMQPGEIDLPTFLPFALFNPTLGITTIVPDMNPTRPAKADPERIVRTINQFKVTTMFGSPAILDKVGRYGAENKLKLPSLNRVLSAGAPVQGKTLSRFSTMLNPTTQIYTAYGATEALPVAIIGSHYLLDNGVQEHTANGGGICIGKPVAPLVAKVIRITDEPIGAWSDDLEVDMGIIGEIVVKGPNVTKAYFGRKVATDLAKIKDGEHFWHRMGDLGYQGEDGLLWFCGRKAHRVRLEGKECYSVQCESIFNKHPQVYRTALVGVDKQAILCVELEKHVSRSNQLQIEKELLKWAANNELTKDIKTIRFHPSFPVDIRHNAKIFREKLAVWAAKK
jgi:acyl-CoA synthetase (AMP-forming)/AMP-acid ligase II